MSLFAHPAETMQWMSWVEKSIYETQT